MNYDKNSFLAGITVGRQLKGWASVGIQLRGYTPIVRNDKGVYDYFYLDYLYDVDSSLTFGRFISATVIYGSDSGVILPDNIERVDAHTIKVYAGISSERRIRVFGSADMGVNFSDGATVPSYGVGFYVDDVVPYELPYMGDSFQWSLPNVDIGETLGIGLISFHAMETVPDEGSVSVAQYEYAEAFYISYT